MKTYVKPELFFESFELSQHIAGCSLKLESGDVGACEATGSIGDVYLDGNNGSWFISTELCTTVVEAYCYTNGSMNVATINS